MVLNIPPNSSTEFLTLKQAASRTLGSTKWLRQQIGHGHLRAFRLGHKILIKPADLDAFVEKRAIAPAVEEEV